ncbi:MAG: hypothetical protein AWU56_2465 [Idiomarina sp. T82-3]|jgi:very-short-patch-repair endonuclease|nr:MAG: hypothetical protein AWU56_2465 [Idiomarina sp. T82-3]
MNCPRCQTPRLKQDGLEIEICVCGYNFNDSSKSTVHANEEFIFHNTRTSHKRYESMVMYALHYSLRDVELLSQHHVIANDNVYKIDGYFPEINLAIEVDEPYHEKQREDDAKREESIKGLLGCEFIRVTCDRSLYEQVDDIVRLVKSQISTKWIHKRSQPNRHSGKYTIDLWEGLVANHIPDMMDTLATKLASQGAEVWYGSISGIPSTSNGEYGFLLKKSGVTFAIYSRKTRTIRVRVMELDDRIPAEFIEKHLIPKQQKAGKRPRFYAIEEKNYYSDEEAALDALDNLLSHL